MGSRAFCGLVAWLGAACAPAAGLSAEGLSDACSGTDPRIEMIVHGAAGDEFWKEVKRGVEDAQAKLKTPVCLQHRPDLDAMKAAIEAAVGDGTTLGLVATIPNAMIAGVIRSVDGIPVVTINSGAGLAGPAFVHVGQDERKAGCVLGAALRQPESEQPEESENLDPAAVCIVHEPGNEALEQRCEGLAVGLGGRVRKLRTGDGWLDELQGLATKRQGVNVVVALGPDSSEIILDRIESEGGKAKVLGQAKLGVFDRTTKVAEAGTTVDFVVDQQPYLQGYLPVPLILADPEKPITMVETGPRLLAGDGSPAKENPCPDRPFP